MALYNDKYWLLKHIRKAYMTTDDTGICEAVMSSENIPSLVKDKLNLYPGSSSSDSEENDFYSESYDIRFEGDFNTRYNRANNSAFYEKPDHERKKTVKMKTIKCEVPRVQLSRRELDELFVEREVKETCSPKKSLLSLNLAKCVNVPLNPYVEYSKFDGSAHVSIPTRKYRIFLTMLPEEHRNYPMSICCLASAKIRELIGLILLKCSTIHGDVPLKPVDEYGLYITEDDGEVDSDFPCLDPRECVAKFGFTCLGLVEHGKQGDHESSEHDSLSIPISSVEKQPAPEKQNSTLQSKRNEAKQLLTDLQLLDGHNRAMVAPLYKSYSVYMMNKMRTKAEVHLGVSAEKLEIDPMQQKGSKLVPFLRQKPVSHHMDSVAWCEIIETRSARSTFRVVYSLSFEPSNPGRAGTSKLDSSTLQTSASFKHYDFETDPATAEEIVQKINLILEIRSSSSRKEFVAARERKHYRKKKL